MVQHTFSTRLSAACSNILFYAVLGGLGAVGLLALLATGSVSPQNLKGLLIALSNAFGLIAGVSTCLEHTLERTPCIATIFTTSNVC